MNRQTLGLALAALLVAGSAFAQTAPPPTQTPPPVQTPPPATQTQKPPAPAAVPAPAPLPFPADSKFGFVDLQSVLSQSALGKAGMANLEALSKKLQSDITALQTKLNEAETKAKTQGALLSEVAMAQLLKDIERLKRELTFKQQEAESEYNTTQQDLLSDFQKKVLPIVEAVGKEKGLYAIFDAQGSGVVYVQGGLNLSAELVKRVDAQFAVKK